MRNLLLTLISFTFCYVHAQTDFSQKLSKMTTYEGYFDFYWDAKDGKIWLEVDKIDQEFLYVNSLAAGVGSNDIGLDRNQLGDTRVVKFFKSGPKLLLVQPNYDYRAESDNENERQSVAEAFAQSVLWGFKIEYSLNGNPVIDLTSFLMQDAHGVIQRLQQRGQGNYKLESSRSAIYLDGTKNFPKNTEFEALLTFTGQAKDYYIRSVTPTSSAVSVRQHHSFIALPDSQYKARTFDPRSGYFTMRYQDYATPIDQSLTKRFIYRHRLEKKDPTAEKSEAVEPIIYYVDRGAPEPVKSALIEGASWWNQAFEAAGYINAFQVKELPADADPLDVRYNVINWVHRSTRGWSYGSSVSDPRTGEIIKGHVLLGSLRVRQDFLIAQGLIEAYENGITPDPRLEKMALARLRQLSAHEVGHTLGLSHNFAASYNDRASVMDYPHPYIALDDNGDIDFSKAYDVGIGDWDKRTILYGYQDFPKEVDEKAALLNILNENDKLGFKYISDRDSRPKGGAHPYGHLWDNGSSATQELERLLNVRQKALATFGSSNIPKDVPVSTLENVLVPLYLAHRYQVEATSKLIGGVDYAYAVNGDKQQALPVSEAVQRAALNALLKTLHPNTLALEEDLITLIPPQALGYDRDRELFKTHTGLTFDPLAAAESAANHTLSFLLDPHRLARLIEQYARNKTQLSPVAYLNSIVKASQYQPKQTQMHQTINRIVEQLTIQHLLRLAGDTSIMPQVSAIALSAVEDYKESSTRSLVGLRDDLQIAHQRYLLQQITQFKANPSTFKLPTPKKLPDGSPIGCSH